jgi:hypothetical protein
LTLVLEISVALALLPKIKLVQCNTERKHDVSIERIETHSSTEANTNDSCAATAKQVGSTLVGAD